MTKINDLEEKLNIDEIEEVAGGKVQALVSGDGREPQAGVLVGGLPVPPIHDVDDGSGSFIVTGEIR